MAIAAATPVTEGIMLILRCHKRRRNSNLLYVYAMCTFKRG